MKRPAQRFTPWTLLFTALLAGPLVLAIRAEPSADSASLRKQLNDPASAVRLRAALTLAETRDAEAIPVLIDLLTELTAEQRGPVEELLTQLAGEWAPAIGFQGEDDIARRIRRDVWAAWWRNTDGASLLAAIGKHTLSAADREKVARLIGKLGDEAFTAREDAAKELFARGRITLPQLRQAVKSSDLEIARRAKELIESIEREPAHHLPVSAIRLLAVRKPAGSVEALLAYLPHAEDETRVSEVRQSLTALALRDGKVDPALLRALADTQQEPRAMAAEVLAQGGGTEGRSAARKLLQDAVPEVRLRAALALALVKDREAVPVLIDLLAVLPDDGVGQVEDALYQLAGDAAPEVSAGTEPAQRKKCRDTWAAWWKTNAERVDLVRLTARPWSGFTVICDANRVYELDRHGKERWTINVPAPIDAVVVPGNRVLVAEWNGNRVTERDLKGNIVWQKQVGTNPTNVQRLPNGNTFIATSGGPMLEVDRTGKEIYKINNVPGVAGAYRSRRGAIVCRMQTGQCVVVDTTGKQLKSFAANHGGGNAGGIDLSDNGHILVTNGRLHKVLEFDSEGRKLRELNAPNPTTATALPNGHVLVSSQGNSRVFELDRAGKIVWEHKGSACYRARRR